MHKREKDMLYCVYMKKQGGVRSTVKNRESQSSSVANNGSWRMWILTCAALAFSLLVMVLLMKQNNALTNRIMQLRDTGYVAEQG